MLLAVTASLIPRICANHTTPRALTRAVLSRHPKLILLAAELALVLVNFTYKLTYLVEFVVSEFIDLVLRLQASSLENLLPLLLPLFLLCLFPANLAFCSLSLSPQIIDLSFTFEAELLRDLVVRTYEGAEVVARLAHHLTQGKKFVEGFYLTPAEITHHYFDPPDVLRANSEHALRAPQAFFFLVDVYVLFQTTLALALAKRPLLLATLAHRVVFRV